MMDCYVIPALANEIGRSLPEVYVPRAIEALRGLHLAEQVRLKALFVSAAAGGKVSEALRTVEHLGPKAAANGSLEHVYDLLRMAKPGSDCKPAPGWE